MDPSFKQVPLILTSSKILSTPTDSGLVKKRRLSECSDASSTNSTADRNALNEKFLELSLDNHARLGSPEDDSIKIEEPLPSLHTITIPKPVRMPQMSPGEKTVESPPKNDSFLENLIKMSQNDVQGISKYLNLDLNSKMPAWDKVIGNSTQNEKFKMGSIFTSYLHSPFSLPFMRPEIFAPSGRHLSDSQFSGGSTGSDSDLLSSKYQYKGKRIGPLTEQERKKKIDQYLEKKANRKWKHIRYNIRKDLADQRERVQGRFVKTPKMFSHSDLMQKNQEKEKEKMLLENTIKNNSDFVMNNNPLSLSSSLGKRTGKPDYFDDSSNSM